MRDVGLARRQLLGGLVGLVGAVLLGVFVVWPQYSLWQELKDQKNGLSSKRPESLVVLPDLTVLGEKRFRQETKARLASVCQQNGFLVKRIDTGEIHPNMYSKMPAGVQEVPMAIRIEGQRRDIKTLLVALTESHPNLQLTIVEITATPPAKTPPAKQPTSTHVQLYVRGLLSVWNPDL